MAEKPTAPRGLGARGLRFWTHTVEAFDLTDGELEVLHEACRTLDNLDQLAAAVERDGATTLGSAGQTVVNPCLTEARGQRLALHRLVAALALPDDDGEAMPSVGTLRARKAAAARWQGHRRDVASRVAMGTD